MKGYYQLGRVLLNAFWMTALGVCMAQQVSSSSTHVVQESGTAPGLTSILLFNTGVNDDGTALPDGAVDPHYQLLQSPDPLFPGPEARVAASSGWPYGLWMTEGTQSRWISPRTEMGQGNNSGIYIYRTSFQLSGVNPATAVIDGQWASDNAGLDIQLNGRSTGISNLQALPFAEFTPFSITNGFASGANTLDFLVHQAATGTPTGLRVELSGVARPGSSTPPLPPEVTITTPQNGAIFAAGATVSIAASADSPSGTIAKVEFYQGQNKLGQSTVSPYTFAWSNVPVGSHELKATARDSAGLSSTSAPVRITVTSGRHVDIVADPGNPEIEPIQRLLLELGLTHSVFHPGQLRFEQIQNSRVILWLHSAAMTTAVTDDTLALLRRATDQGMSLYFIGEALTDAGHLTEASRSAWTELLHLQPASAREGDGLVRVRSETAIHPVVRGFFEGDAVADFAYPLGTGGTATADAEPIATSGQADVLVAFPLDGELQPGRSRIVTQLFSVTQRADAASRIERRKLFENALHWLLGWIPCSVYSLSLQLEAAESLSAGSEIVFTLRVLHQGECDGTGVVVTNLLPAHFQFLDGESTQGTVEVENRVVTVKLGHLSSGADAVIRIHAIALQPGMATNCATVVGKGEYIDERNTACAVVHLTPGENPPTLKAHRLQGATVELELTGEIGSQYAIESSVDLSQWTELSRTVLAAPSIRWTDPAAQSSPRRFYRAVRR